ncbi:MAG TPA: hypothetical protein VFD82_06435 [Planctomycetota bacterium]|nr:hypothetical protein [Planctomycetota bacterium]
MKMPFGFPMALVLAVSVSTLRAQDDNITCDRTAIQWVLPGDFAQALARAQKEQRILLIKGISFGVDDAGAKCATKGVW